MVSNAKYLVNLIEYVLFKKSSNFCEIFFFVIHKYSSLFFEIIFVVLFLCENSTLPYCSSALPADRYLKKSVFITELDFIRVVRLVVMNISRRELVLGVITTRS